MSFYCGNNNNNNNNNSIPSKDCSLYITRDSNFCPTCEYLAWPDPNEAGFTQFDKE